MSDNLFTALLKWRDLEKRHAVRVLGHWNSTPEQIDEAKELADRALHEVRKLADLPLGVVLPLRTAEVVRNVFLPRNPNKLRGAHPDTIAAAKDYIARVNEALGASVKPANPPAP